MHHIRWRTTVDIDGQQFTDDRQVMSEAFSSIQVTVPAGAADMDIQVLPTGADLQFLAIRADRYASDVTYKLGAAANPAVALDAPHLFAGSGAVGLLPAAPDHLFVSNASAQDVVITILTGRDATP